MTKNKKVLKANKRLTPVQESLRSFVFSRLKEAIAACEEIAEHQSFNGKTLSANSLRLLRQFLTLIKEGVQLLEQDKLAYDLELLSFLPKDLPVRGLLVKEGITRATSFLTASNFLTIRERARKKRVPIPHFILALYYSKRQIPPI